MVFNYVSTPGALIGVTTGAAGLKCKGGDNPSKEDIDEMFGWNQAERAKDMQVHYAGRSERSKKARITMFI